MMMVIERAGQPPRHRACPKGQTSAHFPACGGAGDGVPWRRLQFGWEGPNMECSKQQFVDRLKSWPGKRCLLRALVGDSEFRLWLRYKQAALDAFTFSSGTDAQVTIDLRDATAFSYGDTSRFPETLRRGLKFADAVWVKNGDLEVSILLSA